MDEIKDKLTNPSKETMQDKRGHFWRLRRYLRFPLHSVASDGSLHEE